MKLLRFGPPGAEKPGILDADGAIRDLSSLVPDIDGALLADLGRLSAVDLTALPVVEGSPRLGPCIARPNKFLAIGLNYSDHAAESGLPVPEEPIVFSKFTSCIVGPNDTVVVPPGSKKTDWEVELGFVIGKGGTHISEADALDHVAGYCVVNDVSEREFQLERAGTWDKGKGFDTFGPVGPWLVTKDEVADPHKLSIWLEHNGKRYQDGSTDKMVFQVPVLVSYLSKVVRLEPGDLVCTGTPPGVGMGQDPHIFLKGGDVMELGIEGLGSQRQDVVQG